MNSYLAAAVQMNSSPDVQANLSQAEDLIDLAVRQGAELVCLPENFSFLGSDETKLERVHEISSMSYKFLKTMAQRYQITVLGGGFPNPTDDQETDTQKVLNKAVLVGVTGEILASYEKVHLFDVNLPDGNTYRESKTVLAGQNLPPVYSSEKLGNLGLSVCYDVRFPELYRHLADKGAEVLIIPATFTAFTGKDHWQVLLQARAIENTCYVIAPAQTGRHYARRQSHGHAMIVDPWGTVLADAGDQTGVAIAPIDQSRLKQVRLQMPSLQHRVFV
jgi:predicted amidohydrolase